jgi:hypothetical protein
MSPQEFKELLDSIAEAPTSIIKGAVPINVFLIFLFFRVLL